MPTTLATITLPRNDDALVALESFADSVLLKTPSLPESLQAALRVAIVEGALVALADDGTSQELNLLRVTVFAEGRTARGLKVEIRYVGEGLRFAGRAPYYEGAMVGEQFELGIFVGRRILATVLSRDQVAIEAEDVDSAQPTPIPKSFKRPGIGASFSCISAFWRSVAFRREANGENVLTVSGPVIELSSLLDRARATA